MVNSNIMKVVSIAECSYKTKFLMVNSNIMKSKVLQNAPFLTCIKQTSVLKTIFGMFGVAA